jgi:hypothetical protein
VVHFTFFEGQIHNQQMIGDSVMRNVSEPKNKISKMLEETA